MASRGANSQIGKFITESGNGYDKIFDAVKRFASNNKNSLDFRDRDMREAEHIELDDISLVTIQNIEIHEETVTFHAVVAATFTAERKWHGDFDTISDEAWFRLDCEMRVTDKMEAFTVKSIDIYSQDKRARTAFTTTEDFVPVLSRDDLDAEAERFLEKYYPEALKSPIPCQ
jgi:hypothetical protein